MDRISSHEQRKAMWERTKARYDLNERRTHNEHGRIERRGLDALLGIARLLPETAYVGGKRVLRRLFS
jgi:hypothetical protein